MKALLREIEQEQLKKDVPVYRIGDTLRVSVRVEEGDKIRTQMFEGVVSKNRGPVSARVLRCAAFLSAKAWREISPCIPRPCKSWKWCAKAKFAARNCIT